MHLARWYPTMTELGDGRVFALGGLDETGHFTSQSEFFDGSTWSAPANGPSSYVYQPMYPALHQMRDGRLFFSGVNTFGSNAAEVPPGLFDVDTRAYTNAPGLTDDTRRDQGASVLLPPAQDQRVMVIGGGDHSNDVSAVSSTAIADLKAPNPTFTPGPSIDSNKMYVSAVVLPDSTVLQTGGAQKSVVFSGTPVLSAQIFHPTTNTWTNVVAPSVARVYHSSAVLLPDGRVATFGGNPSNSFEMRIEVFTRPYLETGTARPTLTSSGATDLHYGDYTTFATTQAVPIARAVLVRPASTTHESDPNQRLVDLGMTPTATGVSVTMPSEPNLAPPGWYMVFVVDANGVPSTAQWVHLAGPGPTGRGGYTLDGLGGLHPFSVGGGSTPAAAVGAPYWPGDDRARGITVLPDGSGGYVVDSRGVISRFRIGSGRPAVPAVRRPYAPVWAPVRGIAVQRNGAAGFVLDGFGGLHGYAIAGGVPLPITGAPYWPGWSIARGVAIERLGAGGDVATRRHHRGSEGGT